MVLCSGAFDGVHAGHVAYLEAAKAICGPDELLVCAVAPDEYILSAKGRAPYWHQADRLRTVTALGCVDAAIPQQHQTVATLIRDHRQRLFVKGPDWEGRLPEDIQLACEEVGTGIAYVDTPGTHVGNTRPTDEEALARFEDLVLNQKPPAKPWQPVTDYSFDWRRLIEGEHSELIWEHLIPCDDADVLDYGCGPNGHLVRLLREYQAAHQKHSQVCVMGYDPQAVTVNRVDLVSEEPALRAIWDLVICREVLEHCTIREIRRLVTRLCALSAEFVYVTTRFAQQPAHLLSVETSDDLDPTHISMTNQNWLRHLFVLEGFKRRADLEAKLDWQKKGRCLVYERAA